MQSVTDVIPQTRPESELIRPFGASIVRQKIPEPVLKGLWDVFENSQKAEEFDTELAGNQTREFQFTPELLGDIGSDFVDMLGNGGAELYKNCIMIDWETQRDIVTPEHRELVDAQMMDMNLTCNVIAAWGNISVAGDYNPTHTHTGLISGVGYVRMPDDIEQEWASEDHDPSAGMITFIDGRGNNLVCSHVRRKPVVGEIYFFPAWLMHYVSPFRSAGERWSFSFNINIQNLNRDITLSSEQKKELKAKRNAG